MRLTFRFGRRRTAGCLVAVLAATAATAAPAAQAAAPQGEPVVLVHGWTGSGAGVAPLREAFAAAGYPAYAIDLPGQDNIVNARAIADLVGTVRARHAADRVHLVGHSMGGHSARYYVKRLGGTEYVRSYVSMGTGHYGYLPACLLAEDAGGQMCPTSSFIRDLNAGDDTPGPVAYTSLRSSRENARQLRLDGGACLHEVADVDHRHEPAHPAFIQASLAAVRGVCTGTFVTLPVQ